MGQVRSRAARLSAIAGVASASTVSRTGRTVSVTENRGSGSRSASTSSNVSHHLGAPSDRVTEHPKSVLVPRPEDQVVDGLVSGRASYRDGHQVRHRVLASTAGRNRDVDARGRRATVQLWLIQE